MAGPVFSVVMATYGRGRHILPSVRSVLDQEFQDFELLIVGDACVDDTAEVVAGIGSRKIRWDNLPERWRSQAGPNTRGNEIARGDFVAYIGHDDVWSRDHLRALLRVFETSATDFAISGAILHMPAGVDRPMTTGLFGQTDDKPGETHLFPPSSVAHRRDVVERIGGWRRPGDIPTPVDVDFQRRAAEAGMTFRSTGTVTVHKFSAAQRYLCYLVHESDEQEAMLALLARLSMEERRAFLDARVARAKALGTFMSIPLGRYRGYEPGQAARKSAEKNGNLRPAPKTLGDAVHVRQERGEFAKDWEGDPDANGVRWVGLNPNPRWLVNVVHDGEALVSFALVHRRRDSLLSLETEGPDLQLVGLGPPCPAGRFWAAPVCLKIRLSAHDPTVLTFRLKADQTRTERSSGVGLSDLTITPAARGEAFGIRLACDHVDGVRQAAQDADRAAERSSFRGASPEAVAASRTHDRAILGFANTLERDAETVIVSGWVIDASDPEARLEVLAFVDGAFAAAATPDRPLPRVTEARNLPEGATPGYVLRLNEVPPGARLTLLALGRNKRYAPVRFRKIEAVAP